MTHPNDVPPSMLLPQLATELRNRQAVAPPTWATFVKTGVHKQRAPVEPDWWYLRSASVLRKIYVKGHIGVTRLSAEYGGKRDRGSAPYHARSGSRSILREIVHPTIAGMAAEGRPYHGVLYAGVMVTADGPQLLEFNCRLGDPETQAVVPRLDGDLARLVRAAAAGGLGAERVSWRREAAACVVLAAEGYPGVPRRGDAITGLGEALARPGVLVFNGGTAIADGRLVTAGGRVLSVVGRGATVAEALRAAYEAAAIVRFDGAHFRSDIGRGLT